MQSLAFLGNLIKLLTLMAQLTPDVRGTKRKPPEEYKISPKLKIKGQCQVIALNLLGVPNAQDWKFRGSCEEACSYKLLQLNGWMSEKREGREILPRGSFKRGTRGPFFKIDPCLAEFRLCMQDFVYPASEIPDTTIVSHFGSSAELIPSCLCQRALVLKQVWQDSASIANWNILNSGAAAEDRAVCTVDGICERLDKGIGPLGWQCAKDSYVIEPKVDCLRAAQDECPCVLSIYTTGSLVCPKITCQEYRFKFFTFRKNLLHESSHHLCLAVDGMTHIANVASGRTIPQQLLSSIDLSAMTSSLREDSAVVSTAHRPSGELWNVFSSEPESYPNHMHSDFAAAGEGTSGTASVADTTESLKISMPYGMQNGLQRESSNAIESFADAVNLGQAIPRQIDADPLSYEQSLVTLDISYLLSTDDFELNDLSGNAGLDSLWNMPISADDHNLDSLPSLPMHSSLDQIQENQQFSRRAHKRPRTDVGPSDMPGVAGSCYQLGRVMDATSLLGANSFNLDAMPETRIALDFPQAGSDSQDYQFYRPQLQQQQRQPDFTSQRTQPDSLDELSRIFSNLEEHTTDGIPEGEPKQNVPPFP